MDAYTGMLHSGLEDHQVNLHAQVDIGCVNLRLLIVAPAVDQPGSVQRTRVVAAEFDLGRVRVVEERVVYCQRDCGL